MAATGPGSLLIDRGHHDPVGRNTDDEERVVAGAATIEVDAAVPGGHQPFGGVGAHRKSAPAVETNHVAGREAMRTVPVLVDLEPVHARIPLGDDQHSVILLTAPVEIVAATVHYDGGLRAEVDRKDSEEQERSEPPDEHARLP